MCTAGGAIRGADDPSHTLEAQASKWGSPDDAAKQAKLQCHMARIRAPRSMILPGDADRGLFADAPAEDQDRISDIGSIASGRKRVRDA